MTKIYLHLTNILNFLTETTNILGVSLYRLYYSQCFFPLQILSDAHLGNQSQIRFASWCTLSEFFTQPCPRNRASLGISFFVEVYLLIRSVVIFSSITDSKCYVSKREIRFLRSRIIHQLCKVQFCYENSIKTSRHIHTLIQLLRCSRMLGTFRQTVFRG